MKGVYRTLTDTEKAVVKIKTLRETLKYELEHFADRCGIEATKIVAWEAGSATPTRDDIEQIALHTGVPAGLISTRSAHGFAFNVPAPAYGTVRLCGHDYEIEYPIDDESRKYIARWMSSDRRGWLIFRTLNDRMVFVNPAFVDMVQLICDDAEEMEFYLHPELYSAFAKDPMNASPLVRELCMKILQQDPDIETRSMMCCAYFMGKRQAEIEFCQESVLAIYRLEVGDIPENQILEVSDDRGVAAINLERLTHLEAPLETYLQSLAKDARPSKSPLSTRVAQLRKFAAPQARPVLGFHTVSNFESDISVEQALES